MSRILENAKNQVTNGYSHSHQGIDVVKERSQLANIIAHSNGKVVWVQTGMQNAKGSSGNASYGNCVKIQHSNGYYTLYAHLNRVDVSLGQEIKQGQVIGYMGDSGNAYGSHLHFEVRNEQDVRIDPTKYIESDLPQKEQLKPQQPQPKPEQQPQPKPEQQNSQLNLEIVKKTIRGDFGNQPERQKKIEALGFNYEEVRKQVNLNYQHGTTRWDNVKLY